jgi:opacity protein-like surface antigen
MYTNFRDFAESQMNPKLSTWLVTAVALLAVGASAHGADLDGGYPRTPPLPAWAGLYLGANVGGAFSEERTATPFGPWSPNSSGVVGGIQLGYNFMVAPNWLIGVEGEVNATSAQGTVVIPNPIATPTITSNHRWYDTFEGRVGFTQGPWLFYAKGGAAWIDVDYRITGTFNGVTTMATVNNTAAGWTLGTGVEYMWAPGWSAKAEYDFLDFGTQNVGFGALGTSLAVTTQVHEFKIGVNWHWLPGSPFGWF